MVNVYVAGIGMTKFGLFLERGIKSMVRDAVTACIADANALNEDIEAAFFSNMGQSIMEGQTAVPGQIALRPLGLEGIPIVNIENACASASTAFYLACMQVRSGQADIVLAVGVEKMSTETPELQERLIAGAMDVTDTDYALDRIEELAGSLRAPPTVGRRSIFMDIYSAWARGHMRAFGTTQRQLAEVASKNHWHSSMNSLCQYQRQFSVDEILMARPLKFPLTVPMCSPYSDGCAAALICSEKAMKKLGIGANRHIRVDACILRSGIDHSLDEFWDKHITKITADIAYDVAGIGPDDIDVAEVHDATAFGEILNAENLGLVARGDGGPAAERGETRLGGRIPINPSGGLESRGHPLGATGLAQIYELVSQLRGEAGDRQVSGAKVGAAENGGGFYCAEEAAAVVSLLSC